MSGKERALIGMVIGGGILLQIPLHDEAMIHAEHDGVPHSHEVDSLDASVREILEAPVKGPYRAVALEVTGMT